MNTARLRPGFLAEMQRYPSDGWIAGVCKGVADYFEWKVQLVRLVVALLALFTAFWPVFLVYCFFWYVMDNGDLSGGPKPKWSDAPRPSGSPAGTTSSSNAPSATMSDIKDRFARLDARLRRLEEAALNKDDALRREIDQLGGNPPPA